MPKRFLRVAVIFAALTLVLAACGREEEAGSGGEQKTVKIGFIGPLTGELGSFGTGMRNSVDLAIRQANEAKKIEGWTISLDAQDDAATPATGANAASKLASDPNVAGVIGTLNSSVAQQVAPVLQRSSIVQISPANTNPTLTQGENFKTAPKRVWNTYHRLATLDSLQGPFAADYAFKQAGFKTVATVHDQKTYGRGLVEAFTERWKANGGTVTSANTVGEKDRDFGALVTKVIGEKPDFLFYGGEFPVSAPLSAQLHQRGFTGPLMGGDGMQADGFLTGGGVDNDLATNVGAPTSKLPEAKGYLDAYKAAGYKEGPESYGPLSYDSANVLIEALAKVLPGKDSVEDARADIVKAVGETRDFKGITGSATLDQYGDTSNKVLTMYQVKAKKWVDVFTGQFEGT